MKFRKKETEVEAIQFNDYGDGFAVKKVLGVDLILKEDDHLVTGYCIKTSDGIKNVIPGTFIVKNENGEIDLVDKEMFEKTYSPVDTFVDRLNIEHEELIDRFEKCAAFVDSEKFREVVKDDYSAFLLWLQRELMGYYLQTLSCRINIAENITENVSIKRMSFGIAIQALKFGLAIAREGWNGKNLCVFKQVPAHITDEIVPKMQSLPESAKDIILGGKGFIDYTSQCLIYNKETGRADSWAPSISDVFAEDWYIVK